MAAEKEVSWSVYLLQSGKRTYIGSTTDPHRRLRQHNGEIRGGARSTQGKVWHLLLILKDFETRSSACRWERILKCRARGVQDRLDAFIELSEGRCPKGRDMSYIPPENLLLDWCTNYGI